MVEPLPLSTELERLYQEAGRGVPMTLGDLETRLRERGFALLLMLLSVPFLIPNLPGLSTPFGVAITAMGFQLMIGRKPWLPRYLLRRPLSQTMVTRILGGLHRVVVRLERWVRPRFPVLSRGPGMSHLIGFGITCGGVFLSLPLPFPFTNTLPALSILCLTAGMMERDGLFILIGYGAGLMAWGYLAGWLYLGQQGMDWFWN